MNKRVLGIGNALLDVLIPIENEAILEQFSLTKGVSNIVDHATYLKILRAVEPLIAKKVTGGSAANTIHGIAGLGLKTGFIGKVGNDFYGGFMENEMKQNGITPYLHRGEQATGMAITFVTPDSERTFAVYLGAALELSADDLSPELFQGYDIFHIEGYLIQNYDLMRRAMQLAREAGAFVSLDLATYTMVEWHRDFLGEMIEKYVDIIFANEEESFAFTGKQPEEAITELSRRCSISVVKIGERGSFAQCNDAVIYQDAYKVQLVDTTGAGDLYASGFLYGLAAGADIRVNARIATLLASYVIQSLGAKIEEQEWKTIHEKVQMMIEGKN
jgi:sugar/nucleoside kinase (ribokinase family)